MNAATRLTRSLGRAAAFGISAWAAYSAVTWLRYGNAAPSTDDREQDSLLDAFMPEYEVAHRHAIQVNTAAEAAFEAACRLDIQQSAVVRAIFRGRELLLLSSGREATSRPLFEWAESLGWVRLEYNPDSELIFGAVTQPWRSDVTFRGIPAAEFRTFNEPGYAKIVWSIRVDPLASDRCLVRTETRVRTTSPGARERFRRYWAAFSPGIVLIRIAVLRLLKREAESRSTGLRAVLPEIRVDTACND